MAATVSATFAKPADTAAIAATLGAMTATVAASAYEVGDQTRVTVFATLLDAGYYAATIYDTGTVGATLNEAGTAFVVLNAGKEP